MIFPRRFCRYSRFPEYAAPAIAGRYASANGRFSRPSGSALVKVVEGSRACLYFWLMLMLTGACRMVISYAMPPTTIAPPLLQRRLISLFLWRCAEVYERGAEFRFIDSSASIPAPPAIAFYAAPLMAIAAAATPHGERGFG